MYRFCSQTPSYNNIGCLIQCSMLNVCVCAYVWECACVCKCCIYCEWFSFLWLCMEKIVLHKEFSIYFKVDSNAFSSPCIQPSIHPFHSIPFSAIILFLPASLFLSQSIFSYCLYHPYRHMHTSNWCVGQHTVLHISNLILSFAMLNTS